MASCLDMDRVSECSRLSPRSKSEVNLAELVDGWSRELGSVGRVGPHLSGQRHQWLSIDTYSSDVYREPLKFVTLKKCSQHRPPTKSSACQVNAPDISYAPAFLAGKQEGKQPTADVTSVLAATLRCRGRAPDEGTADVSTILSTAKSPATPREDGCAGATCRRVLPWLFFLALCCTMTVWCLRGPRQQQRDDVSVQLDRLAGETSALSARNRQLSAKCLALLQLVRRLSQHLHYLQDELGNKCALNSIQDCNIRKVVDQQLAVYDADKIGLADYALESAGGAVLETPDTVTYYPNSWFEFFSIPLFRYGPCGDASCILQPTVLPGHCWAFKGTHGSVKIRLARHIHVIAVTLEHIPQSIAMSGDVSSAPNKFLVAALVPGPGKRLVAHTLGVFQYNINGPPLQSFGIQNTEFVQTTSVVQLTVLGNHGNQEYTCVYRFRVHGHEGLPSPTSLSPG